MVIYYEREARKAACGTATAKGADPDVADNSRRAPLFHMSRHEQGVAFQLLLEDKRVKLEVKDYYGSTPLSVAVRNGREQTAKLLLATEKVDMNSEDNFGRTPLW